MWGYFIFIYGAAALPGVIVLAGAAISVRLLRGGFIKPNKANVSRRSRIFGSIIAVLSLVVLMAYVGIIVDTVVFENSGSDVEIFSPIMLETPPAETTP